MMGGIGWDSKYSKQLAIRVHTAMVILFVGTFRDSPPPWFKTGTESRPHAMLSSSRSTKSTIRCRIFLSMSTRCPVRAAADSGASSSELGSTESTMSQVCCFVSGLPFLSPSTVVTKRSQPRASGDTPSYSFTPGAQVTAFRFALRRFNRDRRWARPCDGLFVWHRFTHCVDGTEKERLLLLLLLLPAQPLPAFALALVFSACAADRGDENPLEWELELPGEGACQLGASGFRARRAKDKGGSEDWEAELALSPKGSGDSGAGSGDTLSENVANAGKEQAAQGKNAGAATLGEKTGVGEKMPGWSALLDHDTGQFSWSLPLSRSGTGPGRT